MKKLFAIGGEMRNEDLGLYTADNFLNSEMIRLLGKENPKIVYIPGYTTTDLELDCSMFEKNLKDNFGITPTCLFSIYDDVGLDNFTLITEDVDLLYIGGGYPREMLKFFKEKGIDKRLKELYEAGVMLAGVSAGAICRFDYGFTINHQTEAKYGEFEALGFVKGICSPHFDSRPELKETLKILVEEYQTTGYGIPDGSALYIEDDTIQLVEGEKIIDVIIPGVSI